MAFSTYWSKGIFRADGDVVSKDALGGFETELNNASPKELGKFVDALAEGKRLMRARTDHLPDSTSRPFHDWIDRAWFGFEGEPMWFVDSAYSPEEIHQIMRLTAVTLAVMRRDDPSLTIEMHCRCAYERFRTEISRPNSTENLVRVWIFGPYNMASAKDVGGELLPPEQAQQQFDELIENVGPGGPTFPQRRAALLIARRWDALGKNVYIGTPFARDMTPSQTRLPEIGEPQEQNEIERVPTPDEGSDDFEERRGEPAEISTVGYSPGQNQSPAQLS